MLSLTKLLTLILLITVVWYGFRWYTRVQARARDLPRQPGGLPRPEIAAEEMIRCARCGVYVSAGKAASCGRPDCPYR